MFWKEMQKITFHTVPREKNVELKNVDLTPVSQI